ncbi:hypothetical protein AB1Y20_015407 [Prymnesium parvum]|uniref:Protochlorophyllide reductase n=1 Tax=Prymnesium parvum TaxID=97485 RepID=A0AB34K0F4_PRYPA
MLTPSGVLRGKNILLTGGTAGLGTGILRAVVAHGPPSRIFLLCRSEARGQRAAATCGAEHLVTIVLVNLAVMEEVHAAASKLVEECARGETPPIDLCFLNAACLASSRLAGERVITAEHLEAMFATNYCGMYLLLRLLMPTALAPRARLIITGSDAAQMIGWRLSRDNLQGERSVGIGGLVQYAHTKLMGVMLAAELQARADEEERQGGGGVDVCVCHPGAVMSELGNNVSPWLAQTIKTLLFFVFRTPGVAATLIMRPALSTEPQRGYISDGNLGKPTNFESRPFKGSAADTEDCRWLWEETERILEAVLKHELPLLRGRSSEGGKTT